MKTKVEIVGETDFNKEGTSGGERHPRGEGGPGGSAGGRAGRTTRQTTTARQPAGVVVLCSNAVRVPPKKVELFIQKRKSWCGMTWNKTKMIGTFPFDKQPREDLLPLPVWTSRRSTLDLDRVLRHQDYTSVRITVHLRGGVQAKFSTAVDWILNEMTANEFVLRLNGKYRSTPTEMTAVKVTAIRPQWQEEVDDDAVNVETEEEKQTEPQDDVEEMMENKDEGVRSDSDHEEAEERWRNVVVIGGMGRSVEASPDAAASTGQGVNTFDVMVLTNVRRAVAVIMAVCLVAVLVDAWWDGDNFQ